LERVALDFLLRFVFAILCPFAGFPVSAKIGPRFRLRATFVRLRAELLRCEVRRFLRGAGFARGFERGRWDAEDLRFRLELAFRRFPPNPAAICFFERLRRFAILPAFRPGFAIIVSLVVRAI
jgi:hypothetical protein